MPIGTIEEAQQQGLNPAKVATCSERVPGKIQGCPMWTDCHFDEPRMGGFKGSGPRYIGYQLATGDTLPSGDPVVVEGSCMCHVFVRTLQDRMLEGETLRRRGKPGEYIRVCAQEGDSVSVKLEFPFNIDGKVIKQDQRMFKILEDQRIPIDRNDKREASYWDYLVVKMPVPTHPRPGERQATTYAQSIIDKIKNHQARERRLEELSMGDIPRIEATMGTVEDSAPVAEPVKRGPGRPRKIIEGPVG
jgi:hypothetical protein